jgi:hypothetical protein
MARTQELQRKQGESDRTVRDPGSMNANEDMEELS